MCVFILNFHCTIEPYFSYDFTANKIITGCKMSKSGFIYAQQNGGKGALTERDIKVDRFLQGRQYIGIHLRKRQYVDFRLSVHSLPMALENSNKMAARCSCSTRDVVVF